MANNRMSCLVDDGGGTLTVPIFHVSSASGTGLALLHAFLRALPTGVSHCAAGRPRCACSVADLACCATACTTLFTLVLLTCADGYGVEEEDPLSPASPASYSSSASEATQDEAPAHFQARL